jgi:RNA polymerase sigma-70 factor (ECF subfamily)
VKDASDRALVDTVLASGDERAFGALYDRHTPYLYRLALRLAGYEAAAAEDLVHDAWVRAAVRFDAFEGRAQLRTWLAGFVVNAARRAWRTEGRTDELAAEPSSEDAALLAAPDRLDLERAIAKLPPRARQVLVLHDVEGWTHEAIAQQLGIEPGTSKSQLSRARAMVRRELGDSACEAP